MPLYRFYSIGADDQITGPPAIADLADDRSAIVAAEALLNGKAIEIWDGSRVVIRLAPKR
jgi:hypothetical protein